MRYGCGAASTTTMKSTDSTSSLDSLRAAIRRRDDGLAAHLAMQLLNSPESLETSEWDALWDIIDRLVARLSRCVAEPGADYHSSEMRPRCPSCGAEFTLALVYGVLTPEGFIECALPERTNSAGCIVEPLTWQCGACGQRWASRAALGKLRAQARLKAESAIRGLDPAG